MNRTARPPEEEAARRARIERLAHQIWESEGRPEGQAMRHWSMAERLIEAEEEAAAAPQPQKKARRNGRSGKKQPAENQLAEDVSGERQSGEKLSGGDQFAEDQLARGQGPESGSGKPQRPRKRAGNRPPE